jgi:GTP-binding protein
MKILNAEFVISAVAPPQYPKDGLPEVAVVGRSNVGKSSLLNALLQRRALAKVSSTPGKTQLINFFRVTTDDRAVSCFRLVDLPGYGYAKVSRTTREEWGPMIERYLRSRDALCGVIFLIDARGVQPSDVSTWRWLATLGVPLVPVATKIDKLKRGERKAALESMHAALGLGPEEAVLVTSAETKEGMPELRKALTLTLSLRERER